MLAAPAVEQIDGARRGYARELKDWVRSSIQGSRDQAPSSRALQSVSVLKCQAFILEKDSSASFQHTGTGLRKSNSHMKDHRGPSVPPRCCHDEQPSAAKRMSSCPRICCDDEEGFCVRILRPGTTLLDGFHMTDTLVPHFAHKARIRRTMGYLCEPVSVNRSKDNVLRAELSWNARVRII